MAAETRSALTAQLLLLLRLAMSDDRLGPRGTDVLRRVAASAFGLADAEAAALIASLGDLGGERDIARARLALRQECRDHAPVLARLLFDLVAQDPELARRRQRLAARVGDILALDAAETAELAGEPF